jgi:collagenase-like PrtC family protease
VGRHRQAADLTDLVRILGREVDIETLDQAVSAYRRARSKRRENPGSPTAAADEVDAVAKIIEAVARRYRR